MAADGPAGERPAAEWPRVASAAAGALMLLAGGTVYNFGAYQRDLKDTLGASQTEISLIGTAGDVGLYLGGFMGFFFDRFGPRWTALASGAFAATGYALCAVLLAHRSNRGSAFQALFFLVGQANHGFYTTGLMSNVGNWSPARRGLVTGVLAAFFGLSSALFASVYRAAFEPRVGAFFVFCAAVTAALALVGAAAVRKLPYASGGGGGGDGGGGGGGSSSVIAVRRSGHVRLLAITAPPMGLGSSDADDGAAAFAAATPQRSEPENVTGRALLRRGTFWLLFAVLAVLDGATLMFINNLGTFIASAGGRKGAEGLLLIVFSLSNAAGRVAYGVASDRLVAWVPRAMFLVLSALVIAVNAFALLALQLVWLIPFVLTMGFAFGGMFAIVPCLVGELFGLRHYGANWGLMILAPAIGALSYGFLVGRAYDAHAQAGTHDCSGRKCFALASTMAGCTSAVAALLALQLARLTRYNHAAAAAAAAAADLLYGDVPVALSSLSGASSSDDSLARRLAAEREELVSAMRAFAENGNERS